MKSNLLIIVTAVALAAFLGFTSLGVANDRVTIGDPAPEFELPDQDGQLHSLEDYRDQWVVLYFYPKDQTPGCTTQACEFRDNVFAFRDHNAQILGVSLDDVESHKAFAEKHGLPFPLLADVEGETAALLTGYRLGPLAERFDQLGCATNHHGRRSTASFRDR